MLSSNTVPVIIAAAVIVVLVVLLASTRRSLSGPDSVRGTHAWTDGKYPSGFWMTLGVTVGVALGLVLGLAVHSLSGGISIGIGVGLFAGKLLDRRYDPAVGQYTEEQRQERLRRASWGLIVMILLVLATLAAAIIPLLD